MLITLYQRNWSTIIFLRTTNLIHIFRNYFSFLSVILSMYRNLYHFLRKVPGKRHTVFVLSLCTFADINSWYTGVNKLEIIYLTKMNVELLIIIVSRRQFFFYDRSLLFPPFFYFLFNFFQFPIHFGDHCIPQDLLGYK